MTPRSQQTITIEEMLREGKSLRSISIMCGVSRQRVQQIKQRMGSVGGCMQGKLQGATPDSFEVQTNHDMRNSPTTVAVHSVSIQLTGPVFDALQRAAKAAQSSPSDYVEELLLVNLAERGMLKTRK